ncbi:sugar ABC transporter substrate-binding protein [Paenibacillus sp. FSL R10-2734]|uniref:ABC transporter substrate-binding protein n=1 Tax=Paenibacillus sp. FSL R10-2734 TaxID=2954691 RepID=UPI0030DA580E
MTKNRIMLFVTILTIITLLSACTPGGADKVSSDDQSANGSKESVELRFSWWGSQVRTENTLKVIELFEKKYPNIKITGEYVGGTDGYWNKINTQIAGGNAPDLIQLGNNFPEYVSRNTLLDLNPYIGKKINVDHIDKTTIAAGQVDGITYGISLGSNSFGVAYNTELIKKAGMEPPNGDWTWDGFGKYAADLTKALGKGIYGTVDESRFPLLFNFMARQSGHSLYRDGKVSVVEQDFVNWLSMWDKFRKEGATTTAEMAAAYTESPDNSSFVEGKTAMHFIWSNQVNAYQKVMKDEINIVLPPNGGQSAEKGLWLQPSQVVSVNAKTKYPEEAAMFIDFMVNDPEATMILGNERGIPASATAREALMKNATPQDKKIYDFIDIAIQNSTTNDPEPPNGNEFTTEMLNISQSVAFGKKSIAEGSKVLFEKVLTTVNK